MEENKPKTFEEINAKLNEDLKNINVDIEEIENHLQIAQEMMDGELAKNSDSAIIEKYKKGLDELQKGLEMFLGIKDEIQATIAKLHETKAKADEYILKRVRE